MNLRVQDQPGRASGFTVHGAVDQTSTVTTGTVQSSSDPPDSGGHLRFLVEDHRLFLVRETETEPATWQEVDLLDALRAQDDNDGRLLALAVQRPTALAALLLGVDSAERVGQERLDSGVAVTQYRAHVSFEAALNKMASSIDADVLRVVTQRLDGDQVDLDAWIDGNRRLRALAFTGTLDGGRDYSLRLDFRTFGDPGPTTLPTQTTVIDVNSLDDLIRLSQSGSEQSSPSHP